MDFMASLLDDSLLVVIDHPDALSPLLPEHGPYIYQPFSKRQIVDSSKLKDFADDNFKFDKKKKKMAECSLNG